MSVVQINTNHMYGQEYWPGRLAKNNLWLIAEISLKFIVIPGLLYGLPLFFILGAGLLLNSEIIRNYFWLFWLVFWVLAISAYRNYCVIAYYDKNSKTINEKVYLYKMRLRDRSWPLTKFSGISYGTHYSGGGGDEGVGGGFLNVRLHGHHMGERLLTFLSANSRDEMIQKATELAAATGLPLLPEQSTGSQHRLDDMRLVDRWKHISDQGDLK